MNKSAIKHTLFLIIAATAILNLSCSESKPGTVIDVASFEKLRSLRESPILAELVQKKELPPLSERLPEEPLVVEPQNEAGVHGGVWRFDITRRRDVNLVYHIGNPSFLRWNLDATRPVPHFCKDYNVSDDGKIWTVYLRKNVRWSDGHPFTVEDVRFWYEDDALNTDINPIPKEELQVGGQFGIVEIIDDYTFRVVFPDSNKSFFRKLMKIVLFYAPSHYLKQFHVKYADPEKLEQEMVKSGVKKWSELYKKKSRWYLGFLNPDCPSMRPWLLSEGRGSPDTYEFVRNPYYWAVDPDGKQLPYIDRVLVKLSSNEEVLAMNTIAGAFDFQWRRLNFKDYPLLKENADKKKYELLAWPQDRCSDITLYVNQNCVHPTIGPLLGNRDFRIALSLAINREELNLLFYRNVGKPRQATAAEATPYFNPEFASSYAGYEFVRANQILDDLGLIKRDKNGYRVDESGETILILIETSSSGNVIDILQIVTEYWQKIGILADIKVIEGSLLTERTKSAQVMIQARPMGSFNPPLSGTIASGNYIAPRAGLWYNTVGKEGEEPSEDLLKLIRLAERRQKSDLSEEVDVMMRIYKSYAENVWAIGLVGEVPALLAKKYYFRNVPNKTLYSFARGRRLRHTLPEQYWIDPRMRN
jgi:peptide/nickel transport system substrate-binding protein